jgi:hypothetical protein
LIFAGERIDRALHRLLADVLSQVDVIIEPTKFLGHRARVLDGGRKRRARVRIVGITDDERHRDASLLGHGRGSNCRQQHAEAEEEPHVHPLRCCGCR